jgi:quercetin dioxygenase-like cupin family protein
MKKIFLLSLLLAVLCYTAKSQDSANLMSHNGATHVMMNKDELKWMDAPPGLPAGAKVAVLNGDPSKEGLFTIRVMFPSNYKVPPHMHPATENVAVMEGNFYMGTGEQFDEKKAMMLSPGGFSSIPAQTPHYAFTKGKCTIQVHAMGPFAITYINPADDPRNK